MDQIKIGKFIAERRRERKLTQAQLGELLSITDRAVSKWERGLSLPDSSIMVKLCEILEITVNELLCGEKIEMPENEKMINENIIELLKQKERADRSLLFLEIIIGVMSTILLLGSTLIAGLIQMPDWQRIVIIACGFAVSIVGIVFALRIEQIAGYYECKHCGHRYVPAYKNMLFAMHFGRTRFMKCPKCGKMSWQKKVISKEPINADK
ncbi:MAG: helix-turn-helix domain-containing protein [Clostridia bacterium]|nr:helix-turn-helix domain-containing protein [Clostridia bacterium]